MRKEGTEGLGSMKELREGPKMEETELLPPSEEVAFAVRPKCAKVLPEDVEEVLAVAFPGLRWILRAALAPSAALPSSALMVALLS